MALITTPYRSSRQAVWSCRFRDPVEVAKLGGTLTGSPTFTGDGIRLDGATQYGTFPLTTEFTRPSRTIKCVVTPDFALGDSQFHYIYELDSASTNYLNKSNGNVVQSQTEGNITCNGDPSVYWNEYGKNEIVQTIKSGSIVTYVNGGLIDNEGDTFGLTFGVIGINVGADLTPGNFFAGTIHEVSIYDGLWTEDEVADDYNKTTYHFINRSSLYLDMAEATTGPDGLDVTLDKSRNNHTVTLGDGSSNQPSFLNPGFGLDGLSQYIVAEGAFDSAPDVISSAVCFVPHFAADADEKHFVHDAGNRTSDELRWALFHHDNAGSNRLRIYAWGSSGAVDLGVYGPLWKEEGVNVGIIAGSSSVGFKFYLNGQLMLDYNVAWSIPRQGNFYLGLRPKSGDFGNIDVYGAALFFGIELTPTQVRELTNQLEAAYGAK